MQKRSLVTRFFLPVAALLLLAASRWPERAGVLAGSPPTQASTEVSKSGIAWRTDLTAALAESAESGKPVMVDFTASWCPPCIRMKQSVWPDPAVVAAVNGGTIPVLIDVDVAANAPTAERYAVQAIPDVRLLDSKGNVVSSGN